MLTITLTHLFTHYTREKISPEKISAHIKTLSSLRWSEFSGNAFSDAIGCIKDEIAILCQLLQQHKDSLGLNARRKFFAKQDPKPAQQKSIPKVFKGLLNSVKLSDLEFHSVVDGAYTKKKAPGRASAFAACVKSAVNNVVDELRGMESYKPLFLTDEKMCIDKFGEACGQPFLNSQTRSQYRENFRKVLAAGVENMRVHFYGKVFDGTKHPDCICIWKVPTAHGPQHEGKVASAIDLCRNMLPKEMSNEAVRNFNHIMNNISDIPAGVRDALRNYLFVGVPDPDSAIADEHVKFVLDMAAGEVSLSCTFSYLQIMFSASFHFVSRLLTFPATAN